MSDPKSLTIYRDNLDEPNAGTPKLPEAGAPSSYRPTPPRKLSVNPWIAFFGLIFVGIVIWLGLRLWDWADTTLQLTPYSTADWLNAFLALIVKIVLTLAIPAAIVVALLESYHWSAVGRLLKRVIRLENNHPMDIKYVEKGVLPSGPHFSLLQSNMTQRVWGEHSDHRGIAGQYAPSITIHGAVPPNTPIPQELQALLAESPNRMPFDTFWEIVRTQVIHLKLIGASTSGKSTACQALVNDILESNRDQVAVLSPIGALDDWAVPAIGVTDMEVLAKALSVLIAEGNRRQTVLSTMTRAEFSNAHSHIWIFVDETPEVASNPVTKAIWKEFFQRFGSRARHVHMHVVVMAQTETTAALGTEGNAAIKENLTTIYTKRTEGKHRVEIAWGEERTNGRLVTKIWSVDEPERLREMARFPVAYKASQIFLTDDMLQDAEPLELSIEDLVEEGIALLQQGTPRSRVPQQLRDMGFQFDQKAFYAAFKKEADLRHL